MRTLKLAGVFVACVILVLGAYVVAADNPMGIADTYRITFSEKVRVANTLLPQGAYEIRHVMEGQDHIMVFHQLHAKTPLEVRAKCTLVPLEEKAKSDEQNFVLNDANERVLQALVFKGDRAKHIF